MRKIVYALAAATLLGGAVYGAAASLNGINSASIGADDTLVASCDSDSVSVDYNSMYGQAGSMTLFPGMALPFSGYYVTQVNVSGIDDDCLGETLRVTLTKDGEAIASGQQSVAVGTPDDNNAFVSVWPAPGPPLTYPLAEDVNDIHIEIG